MSMSRWIAVALALAAITPASAGVPYSSWPSLVTLQSRPKSDTKDKEATDPEALKKLIERIRKVDAEVEKIKAAQGAPAQPKVADDKNEVMILVDVAHVGMHYGETRTRYVAIRLLVANPTDQPVSLMQDQISCEIDGDTRKLETIPAAIASVSALRHQNQSYGLSMMQPEKSRTVPAKGQISFWLAFVKLPVANTIPKCKLNVTIGATKREIDINLAQQAVLDLQTERIGPRSCLALMTVNGLLTMFNTQSLVDEIDKLVSQKVSRLVIRWGADAQPPDAQLLNWLQNSTSTMAQVRNANDQFPHVSAALREFHLVKFSENDNSVNYGYRGNSGPNRIHATAVDAVGAALRTAYLALPRDELLQEIREGHPLTRSAALTYGGGRLEAQHLPLIFEWVGDKDADVQKAALQTLSNFGEPEAIEKLVFYVKRGIEPLSSTAVESLAGSRFGSAHAVLLELLKSEPADSKRRIVQVLAKYPRPAWSDTLYEYARDSKAGLNLEAVKALVQVGHPKLVEVLEAGLKGQDKGLRDFSFQTLADQPDERSERLAIEYTLEHLKSSPPDGKMTQLLIRTKDGRAIPLLLNHLDKAMGDKNATINLLVTIGDQAVAEKLVEKYRSLQSTEKAQVLNGLRQFRHPKFRELAGAELTSNDGILVSAAAHALMQEGNPDSERLLIAALEKQTAANGLSGIMNALATFGTNSARAALLKAKQSSDKQKHDLAQQALLQIRRRSPGYLYFDQGLRRLVDPVDNNDKQARQQQEKDAMEFFDLALQLEPQLSEAHAGRAKVFLRQEKMAECGKAFEKALELSPDTDDSEIITGLAAVRVSEGRLEDAEKLIDSHREQFKKVRNGLFLYNTACVFSRAVEYLRTHKDVPNATTKIDALRKKCLADLDQCIKDGWQDFDWMAKDPDFNTLHDDEDFKKILAKKPAETPEDNTETEGQ